MVVKKTNVIGVNVSDKALLCLQHSGYLDKRKKATGKNISRFISELICDYFDVPRLGVDRYYIREKELRKSLLNHQKARDDTEEIIKQIAQELSGLRELKKQRGV